MIDEKTNLPELPKGWVWTELGEICEIILGQSPPSSTYNENGGGLPFYQGKLEFGNIYPTTQKWCTAPKKIAEKGDVLISVRAPVGPTNICSEKSCIGRGLAAIRGLGGIETFFMLYLMRTFENVISKKGTGTTFNAITGSQLREFVIPLPPLPEQHRIVAKIEELFTKLGAGVEALENIKAQLRRYRQAVLKHAFEGKLTEEWREAHKSEIGHASMLLERIKEERRKNAKGKYRELPPMDTSDLPELPKGWVWTRLGEVTSPSKERYNPFDSKKEIFIGLEHIEGQTGKILARGNSSQIRSTKTKFCNGDILYGRLRPYLNKVCVPEFDGICSTDILVFPKSRFIESKYLAQLLSKNEFVRYATQNMSGVQHPRVNFEILSQYIVPLPPLPEQHKIVEEIGRRLSAADGVEKVVEQSLKRAERLRQSILKKAFESRLAPQDPSDEPAEKLLERIKAEKAKREATRKGKRRIKIKRARKKRR